MSWAIDNSILWQYDFDKIDEVGLWGIKSDRQVKDEHREGKHIPVGNEWLIKWQAHFNFNLNTSKFTKIMIDISSIWHINNNK